MTPAEEVESNEEIVARALKFIDEFNGNGRCALNAYHSEALAKAYREAVRERDQWLGRYSDSADRELKIGDLLERVEGERDRLLDDMTGTAYANETMMHSIAVIQRKLAKAEKEAEGLREKLVSYKTAMLQSIERRVSVEVERDALAARLEKAESLLIDFSWGQFDDGHCWCDAGGMLEPHKFPHRAHCREVKEFLGPTALAELGEGGRG